MDTKHRILIVDDEPGVTRILRMFLERTGDYVVREENRGARAIAAAREFAPDLILLDVIMPDRDGGSIAADLSDDPLLGGVPIVFLTATVSRETVGPGRAASYAGRPLIAKPARPREVIERIVSIIGSRAEAGRP